MLEEVKTGGLEFVITAKKGVFPIEEEHGRGWPFLADHGYVELGEGLQVETYSCCESSGGEMYPSTCFVAHVLDGEEARAVIVLGARDSHHVMGILAAQFEYESVYKLTKVSVYELQDIIAKSKKPEQNRDELLFPVAIGELEGAAEAAYDLL